MRDEAVDGRVQTTGWIERDAKTFARPTVLVVEDDQDIRELLVLMLQTSGLSTLAFGNAEGALNALRHEHVDLLLTDYALPGRTGTWLLDQANAEALLDDTPVIVVTAHPEPQGVEQVEVVFKPFDLDDLVGRVRNRLAAGEEARRRPVRRTRAAAPREGSSQSDCPEPLEVLLYVGADSPRSESALRAIRHALGRRAGHVRLRVHRLSSLPSGDGDRSAASVDGAAKPPLPRTLIVGHLDNADVLLELLHECAMPM
jgi:CheY-like chemotaxis protein